jgi:hypothetical protein
MYYEAEWLAIAAAPEGQDRPGYQQDQAGRGGCADRGITQVEPLRLRGRDTATRDQPDERDDLRRRRPSLGTVARVGGTQVLTDRKVRGERATDLLCRRGGRGSHEQGGGDGQRGARATGPAMGMHGFLLATA